MSLIYCIFFIFLNYYIYSFLWKNRNVKLIEILIFIAFFVLFFIIKTIPVKIFLLLSLFSLSQFFFYFSNNRFNRKFDDFKKINPKIDDDFFNKFRKHQNFSVKYFTLFGITFFQILVILSDDIQSKILK